MLEWARDSEENSEVNRGRRGLRALRVYDGERGRRERVGGRRLNACAGRLAALWSPSARGGCEAAAARTEFADHSRPISWKVTWPRIIRDSNVHTSTITHQYLFVIVVSHSEIDKLFFYIEKIKYYQCCVFVEHKVCGRTWEFINICYYSPEVMKCEMKIRIFDVGIAKVIYDNPRTLDFRRINWYDDNIVQINFDQSRLMLNVYEYLFDTPRPLTTVGWWYKLSFLWHTKVRI